MVRCGEAEPGSARLGRARPGRAGQRKSAAHLRAPALANGRADLSGDGEPGA